MRRLFHLTVTTLLPAGALLLHGIIFISYARRWDKVAALTVFPFWAWALLGMLMAGSAWLFTRRRLALGVAALWLVTMLVYSDETVPLLRPSSRMPQPGPAAPAPDGKPVLRIATLNCKAGHFNPRSPYEVIPWSPDIVLLQESANSGVLQDVARQLYGGDPAGHYAGGWECGLITRGRTTKMVTGNFQHSLLATVHFGKDAQGVDRIVEVACVHLQGAETDLRLYSRETLSKHALNRLRRRAELQEVLTIQTLISGRRPAVVGGDFNAPQGDAIFRLLSAAGFRDAFAEAGAGWPNTFPNYAPMLRIDQQWSNARLIPVRGRTVRSQHSDHRMVICDYVLE
ncbi:MAG: Endonuclease/exonuclease/phosphatase [Verrucomicrobiales bacterium]|nr:Endonuclease/exonuclease/phosphatase [Verrucomicrobiales bacterium]